MPCRCICLPSHVDLTGQRFGKLTVLERWTVADDGQYVWRCACDCGGLSDARMSNLRRGRTRSCGCMAKLGRPLKADALPASLRRRQQRAA